MHRNSHTRVLRTLITSLLFTGLAPLTVCNADAARNDEMVLELSRPSGFFAQGFPTDLRNHQGRIDVHDFPRPLNLFTLTYRKQIARTDFGYSPAMPLYLQFESGFQPSAAAAGLTATEFASADAPVQLIDIDPDSPDYGQRFPLQISITQQADQYRPAKLLQVRPVGKPLRENTTYALLVTRDFAANAQDIKSNPELDALLEGRNPRTINPALRASDAAKAQQVYGPLHDFIASHSINSADIIGATVWTTGNPTRYMQQVVDKVSHWTPQQPTQPWKLREETADYCVLESTWKAPGLQRGAIPYLTGGSIAFDAGGEPLVQYERSTPVIITIPKQHMPANGFPILHYHHGTDGKATQVFERGYTDASGQQEYTGSPAQVAAQRGWATAAMGGHLGADHQKQLPLMDRLLQGVPGFSLNHTAYNFLNPQAMRDNLAQMVAERTLFRNLVLQTQLDASLCPGAHSDSGKFSFATDEQVVMGQSLGSMTASMAVANDQDYRGLIATGAGTYGLGLVMFFSVNGKDVGSVVEKSYLHVTPGTVTHDPFHPVWAMAELALAPANVALHTAHWLQQPDRFATLPHVLVVEGHYDEQVTLPMQRPYLASLGTDLVNDELDVAPQDQLLPDLQTAGYAQLFSPVSGNRDGRTVAMVRYPEDGILSGHHVTFQYPQPQHQYGCFLQDIAAGVTPAIIRGSELGGSCE